MQNVFKKRIQFTPQMFLLGIIKDFTKGETKLVLYMFIAATLLIAQHWKKDFLPTIDQWIQKEAGFAEMAKISAFLKDQKQENYTQEWAKWIDYIQNKYQTRKYYVAFR